MSIERIRIHLTEHGIPCLWESGGGYTNTGSALIITTAEGEKKRALFIQRTGNRSCLEHALIPVRVGNCLVTFSYHRESHEAAIHRIIRIEQEEGETWAYTEEMAHSQGKSIDGPNKWVLDWNIQRPEFESAVAAAITKASRYHCREAVYCLPPEPKKKPTTDGKEKLDPITDHVGTAIAQGFEIIKKLIRAA